MLRIRPYVACVVWIRVVRHVYVMSSPENGSVVRYAIYSMRSRYHRVLLLQVYREYECLSVVLAYVWLIPVYCCEASEYLLVFSFNYGYCWPLVITLRVKLSSSECMLRASIDSNSLRVGIVFLKELHHKLSLCGSCKYEGAL